MSLNPGRSCADTRAWQLLTRDVFRSQFTMISKPLAVGLLAAGCLTAAAGGAFIATRSNAADAARAQQAVTAAPAARPVSETEGVIAPSSQNPAPETAPAPAITPERQAAAEAIERPRPSSVQRRADTPRNARPPSAAARPAAASQAATAAPGTAATDRPTDQNGVSPAMPAEAPAPEPQRAQEPVAPPAPQFQELVVPASSVIGLQVQSSVSSERARVEDRVEARVTRDVMAGNSVAIPAGTHVLGTVIAVDRGGKIKERARLDVRFHTLVLADGTETPMRTETISRFGESPTGESARKIGGAAIGGAILGAIMGGGKGAAIGGATGAAGGTAVVMAGDRNAATLAAGTILSVRLASPVSIEVEK
jgi:type IV secretory pathway VirB10-like protein